MTNIYIAVPAVDSRLDYSDLIKTLSGEYIISDIKSENIKEDGTVEEIFIDHPNKNQDCPDYSNKIIFVYKDNSFEAIPNIIQKSISGNFNISKMWNLAIQEAKNNGATHLVLLNYIKNINPFIIQEAVNQSINSDVINISDGSAFILNLSSSIMADEEFKVYFSDLDIFNRSQSMHKTTFEYDGIEIFDNSFIHQEFANEIQQDGVSFEEKYS